MPQRLDALFSQIVERAKVRKGEFPAKNLSKAFYKFMEDHVDPADIETLKATFTPLTEVLDRYAEGQKVHEFDVFSGLLEQYAEVEKLFSGRSSRDEEVILKLRDENKEDSFKVVQIVLSHSRVGAKNNLILAILDEYKPNKPNVGNVAKYFRTALRKLTELESRQTAKVTLKARETLIQCAMPSLEERAAQMEHTPHSSSLGILFCERSVLQSSACRSSLRLRQRQLLPHTKVPTHSSVSAPSVICRTWSTSPTMR